MKKVIGFDKIQNEVLTSSIREVIYFSEEIDKVFMVIEHLRKVENPSVGDVDRIVAGASLLQTILNNLQGSLWNANSQARRLSTAAGDVLDMTLETTLEEGKDE